MWCRQCQQDVPAVAQGSEGPLVCPRCRQSLRQTSIRAVADAGIDLGSFPQQSSPDVEQRLPFDSFAQKESRRRLQRIGRKLQSPCRRSLSWHPSSTLQTIVGTAPVDARSEQRLRRLARQLEREAPAARRTSWLLSLLIAVGVIGFSFGLLALGWSAAFNLSIIWQWGMTTTIAAEGLLIVGLTSMAWRLWRNGRSVNRKLQGMDQQLTAIHELTGSLSAGHLSASQHYYHCFNQVANPHMLMANLRGQIDQLAERVGA